MASRVSVSTAELAKAVRHLGLSGRPVCVHCSLRSFGHVDGGAGAIVDVFLDEAATILVPSFSWSFSVVPPRGDRPARNGTTYQFPSRSVPPEPFVSDSTAVDRDMGALSKAVVSHPSRHRGAHPLCSFSALGPLAADLVSSQRPNAW